MRTSLILAAATLCVGSCSCISSTARTQTGIKLSTLATRGYREVNWRNLKYPFYSMYLLPQYYQGSGIPGTGFIPRKYLHIGRIWYLSPKNSEPLAIVTYDTTAINTPATYFAVLREQPNANPKLIELLVDPESGFRPPGIYVGASPASITSKFIAHPLVSLPQFPIWTAGSNSLAICVGAQYGRTLPISGLPEGVFRFRFQWNTNRFRLNSIQFLGNYTTPSETFPDCRY